MNILPFLAISFIVLSYIFYSQLSVFESFKDQKDLLSGFYIADRKCHNLAVEKAFDKAPKKKQIEGNNSKNKSPSAENDKTIASERCQYTRQTLPYRLKVNLFTLFTSSQEAKYVEKLFISFIKATYSHCDFYYEKLAEDLIRSLKQSAQKQYFVKNTNKLIKLSSYDLWDLQPTDSKLADAYYRMLKGTIKYDPQKKLGYLSMLETFSIEPKRASCIHFASLTPEMLVAFFGDGKARAILKKEQELALEDSNQKQGPAPIIRTLSKEEFENVMQGNSKNDNDEMLHLLDFGRVSKIKNMDVTGKDDKTSIQVKKTIFY